MRLLLSTAIVVLIVTPLRGQTEVPREWIDPDTGRSWCLIVGEH